MPALTAGVTTRAALALALALAGRAAAAGGDDRGEGPFLGAGYRYGDRPVHERALLDVVALPADAPRWGAGDVAALAGVAVVTIGLMLPLEPSLDVRLDRAITDELDPRLPTVWTVPMQVVLWGGIATGGLGGWWWAAASGRSSLAQGFSLMGEAVAVSQAYHVSTKLLLGREGPRNGEGEGRLLGPAAAIAMYPAGTPSGHAATLYALLSVWSAYFRPALAARLAGHAVVGGLVLFHVVDHRHFLSDVVSGSAIGWGAGQWVVSHRASRGAPGASIAVFPVPGGGGVALGGAF